MPNLLMRVSEVDFGQPGILIVRGFNDDPQIYRSAVISQGGPTPTEIIQLVGMTRLFLMDIPMLRDSDNDPGFYLAAVPDSGDPANWRGSVVFRSLDLSIWNEYTFIQNAAISGSAITALPAPPQNRWTTWDEVSTVDVRLHAGAVTSSTKINVLNGANAALLGNEVIQFRDISSLGNDDYRLSGLLRGRRGTELEIGTHAIAERFALADAGTWVRQIDQLADLDISHFYRAVSLGQVFGSGVVQTFTNTGKSLHPYSPCFIKGARDGSLNLTITWLRRTRIGGSWRDLIDVLLGEDSESYEVDVLDGPGGTVLRTLTSSTESVVYSAANQITDFGSEQSAIDIEAFQMSASVGRGFKRVAVV